MNFEQIRTIIDQKDEKGWPRTLAMFGVIHEFKGEGMSDNKKPFKKVSIKDDAGELHNVTLRGTLPDITLLNKRAAFNLSAFNGDYQGQPYIGYSGFWDSRAQVAQEAAQQPQEGQASAGSARTTHQPQKAAKPEVDWTAIAEGKVRCNILSAMLQGGKRVDFAEVLWLTEFVMTGKDPAVANAYKQAAEEEFRAAKEIAEPDPEDNNIPF